MKVLVTGAHGQLARSLVERGKNRSNIEMLAVGRPELDLERPGSARAVIDALKPDIVINAAAYTSVDQAEDEPARVFRINAEGAGEVAAAAAAAGAAVVQISTDYVFDGRADRPYVENDPLSPLNVYGASKAAGEDMARAANPRQLVIRTSWVVSPFGKNFVKTMIAAAQQRDPLKVVADQRGNPSSALDLADALLAMLAAEPRWGETYHVAGSGETSWCGFAEAIMAECRMRGLVAAEVRPILTDDWPTKAARPRNSVLDSSRFARDFGFVMPHWRQSLSTIVGKLASGRG